MEGREGRWEGREGEEKEEKGKGREVSPHFYDEVYATDARKRHTTTDTRSKPERNVHPPLILHSNHC